MKGSRRLGLRGGEPDALDVGEVLENTPIVQQMLDVVDNNLEGDAVARGQLGDVPLYLDACERGAVGEGTHCWIVWQDERTERDELVEQASLGVFEDDEPVSIIADDRFDTVFTIGFMPFEHELDDRMEICLHIFGCHVRTSSLGCGSFTVNTSACLYNHKPLAKCGKFCYNISNQ